MIAVKPGGFQLPIKPERQPTLQTRNGNSGNGGRPNPPTIVPQQPGSFPRVNLNPVFQIGDYNNAEESCHFPRFNEYWKQQYNTNNPIKATPGPKSKFGGLHGNAGEGNNGVGWGAGFGLRPWTPYDLKTLGVDSGISQSFPYNPNSTTLEGQLNRVWQFNQNINDGEPVTILGGYNTQQNEDFNMMAGLVLGAGKRLQMGDTDMKA